MISHSDLADLAGFDGQDYPVISLYFNLNVAESGDDTVAIRLKSVMDRVAAARESYSGAQVASLDADTQRLREFVRDMAIGKQKALVVFAAQGAGLWQSYVFPQQVTNRVVVGPTPYVAPLHRLLSQDRRALTALVEQGKTRLFAVSREDVAEVEDLYTQVPGRHDQGGWAQARLQRHHDGQVFQHLKTTAVQIFGLYQDPGFDHLFLSGTDELLSPLRDLLHPYTIDRLGESLSLPFNASAHEVKQATIAEIDRLLGERALETVENVIDQAASAALGVTGIESTLQAVQRGQAATVVLVDGLRAPGFFAPEMDYYTVRRDDPLCAGQTLEPIEDTVEILLQRALDTGAEVVSIDAPDAMALLEPHGGAGAILRFR